MKKEYAKPQMEVLMIEVEGVICASGDTVTGDGVQSGGDF